MEMPDDNNYSSLMSAAGRSSTPARAHAHGPDDSHPDDSHPDDSHPDDSHPDGAAPEGDDGADEALLRLITVSLSATIRAGAAARPPLSPTQVRTLTMIARSPGGLSINAVAVAISASNPSASRLCQRLVRDGLLDRAAGPGNELRMSLSPHGHRTLDAVNDDRVADVRARLDRLPPARRRRAVTALRDLADQP
jgi:DNA-binding MarR family transcriptional regulator